MGGGGKDDPYFLKFWDSWKRANKYLFFLRPKVNVSSMYKPVSNAITCANIEYIVGKYSGFA